VSMGSGNTPQGIPYTQTYHLPYSGATSVVFMNPIASATGTLANLGPPSAVFLPVACTPSATFWTYSTSLSGADPLTFTLYQVSPNNSPGSGPGWSLGDTISGGSCQMNIATIPPVPAMCTFTASAQVQGGTWLTIEVSGDATALTPSPGSAFEIIQGFSCQ
jgi:hypothetical protein